MKKLFALLIILALTGAGYLLSQEILDMKPGRIAGIEITDLENNKANTYGRDSFDAVKLAKDLNGPTVQSLPEIPLHTFRLTLKHILGFKKSYTIYFDEQQSVYVRDKSTGRLSVMDKPAFFNSHAGFDSLYPYGKQPAVIWNSSFGEVGIQSESRSWSFKKRDGSWYTTSQESEGSGGVNSVDSQDDSITFTSDNPPDTASVEVSDNTGLTVLKQVIKDNFIPVMNRDGSYDYKVTMDWSKSENPYKGAFTYQFGISVDLPAAFEFSKISIEQGEVVKVTVHNVNDGQTPELKQKLFSKFTFYRSGGEYVGYLPTGYAVKPGEYQVEYGLTGSSFTRGLITIKPRAFHIQQLFISKEIETSTRNEAANAEYDKYFTPVRLASSGSLYYTDPFVLPAKGRLSTEYGETRYVNGSPTSYRHSGIDIASPKGTPVYAVNRGKVVLSMFLTLTGNTIVIDHGQGLFSIYFHMNERLAEQDSIVERGQQIGTIGTTGFSTGPHLHFTMSYFERNIEPGWLLANTSITQNNYRDILK